MCNDELSSASRNSELGSVHKASMILCNWLTTGDTFSFYQLSMLRRRFGRCWKSSNALAGSWKEGRNCLYCWQQQPPAADVHALSLINWFVPEVAFITILRVCTCRLFAFNILFCRCCFCYSSTRQTWFVSGCDTVWIEFVASLGCVPSASRGNHWGMFGKLDRHYSDLPINMMCALLVTWISGMCVKMIFPSFDIANWAGDNRRTVITVISEHASEVGLNIQRESASCVCSCHLECHVFCPESQ